jgi:hypothetical protein
MASFLPIFSHLHQACSISSLEQTGLPGGNVCSKTRRHAKEPGGGTPLMLDAATATNPLVFFLGPLLSFFHSQSFNLMQRSSTVVEDPPAPWCRACIKRSGSSLFSDDHIFPLNVLLNSSVQGMQSMPSFVFCKQSTIHAALIYFIFTCLH